jgi:hypothetical protein
MALTKVFGVIAKCFFETPWGKIIWFSLGLFLSLLCWGSKGWVAFLFGFILLVWIVVVILFLAFGVWKLPKLKLTKR